MVGRIKMAHGIFQFRKINEGLKGGRGSVSVIDPLVDRQVFVDCKLNHDDIKIRDANCFAFNLLQASYASQITRCILQCQLFSRFDAAY